MTLEPVLLQIHQVNKVGHLFPASRSAQSFGDVLRNAKRATKTLAQGGEIAQHRQEALAEVQEFLAEILQNSQKFSARHRPDYTGASAPMNIAVRQLFWMHRIRTQLGEASAEFNSSLPYAGIPWLQAKYDGLLLPTDQNIMKTRDFLEAWRTVL
jgi:hypothetical protein